MGVFYCINYGRVVLGNAQVAAYLSLNISLNLLNKWTIAIYGFKFPILLSMCHQAFSAVALAPTMLLRA